MNTPCHQVPYTLAYTTIILADRVGRNSHSSRSSAAAMHQRLPSDRKSDQHFQDAKILSQAVSHKKLVATVRVLEESIESVFMSASDIYLSANL
jgi:hypothetical protein